MLHIINITNDKQQQQQHQHQQQQQQQHQNHVKYQGSLILIVFKPIVQLLPEHFTRKAYTTEKKPKHIKVKKCLFIVFHFSASE